MCSSQEPFPSSLSPSEAHPSSPLDLSCASSMNLDSVYLSNWSDRPSPSSSLLCFPLLSLFHPQGRLRPLPSLPPFLSLTSFYHSHPIIRTPFVSFVQLIFDLSSLSRMRWSLFFSSLFAVSLGQEDEYSTECKVGQLLFVTKYR